MIKTFYLPGRVCSTDAIREIAAKADTEFTMICLKPHIEWVYLGQEGTASNCSSNCAIDCARKMATDTAFRDVILGI